MAQLVKNLPVMQETWVDPCVGKIPWRRGRLPTPVFWPREFNVLACSLQILQDQPGSVTSSMWALMANVWKEWFYGTQFFE